jgi:hypothetical protein
VWLPPNAQGRDYAREKRDLRTTEIHACGICGIKTNRYGVYYWMGYPSLRLVCPYRNDGGDGTEINRKHSKLQAFQDRLTKDLTRREIQDLHVEIRELKAFFSRLPGDVIEPGPGAAGRA